MAKEGTVAPKERINIRYKPATGDAREEIELPLKMVVLGDFTMKPDDTPVEDRRMINVDKDNFNEVMASHDLSLDLNVANRLDEGEGGESEEMAVSLKINTLKDFEPENVAQQVPELKKLLELREALTALKGPLGNMPQFRKAIQGMLEDDTAREKLLAELTAATAKDDEKKGEDG